MAAEIIQLAKRRDRRLTRTRFYNAIVSAVIADGEAQAEQEQTQLDRERRQAAARERQRLARQEKQKAARIEREYKKWLKDLREAEERRAAEACWGLYKKHLVPGRGYADPAWRNRKQRAEKIEKTRARSARTAVGGQ